MTLGTRIAELRTKHNMSQGFLAEKMNVSRQSVSKWETDASVPDIDNLIFLSNLFNVTLDELVKGEKPQAQMIGASEGKATFEGIVTEEQGQSYADKSDDFNIHSQSQIDDAICTDTQEHLHKENTDKKSSYSPKASDAPPEISQTQKTLGYIFLTVGIITTVFGFIAGLVLCVPGILLIVYGILCLLVKKHVGLIIGWATLVPCYIMMPFVSGIMNLGVIFNAYLWTQVRTYWINIVLSLCMWAALLILTYTTVRITPLRKYAMLAVGWVFIFNTRGWLGFSAISTYMIAAIQHRDLGGTLAIPSIIITLVINTIAIVLIVKTVMAVSEAYRNRQSESSENQLL